MMTVSIMPIMRISRFIHESFLSAKIRSTCSLTAWTVLSAQRAPVGSMAATLSGILSGTFTKQLISGTVIYSAYLDTVIFS